MTTKTLLLTAVLSAAGITTSLAQPYASSYGVGFVSLDLVVSRINLIANPLDGTNNELSTIFTLPHDAVGTLLFRWIPSTFGLTDAYTYVDDLFGGAHEWLGPDGATVTHDQLSPGEGFYIQPILPLGDPRTTLTITFIGNIRVGNLATPLGGINLVTFAASEAPTGEPVGAPGIAGTLELPNGIGDTIYLYDSTQGNPFVGPWTSLGAGTWLDPDGMTLGLGPVIKPGHGFVLQQVSGTETSWPRTFSVN